VFDDTCIREISPTANTVTLAGSFTQNGFANGAGNVALFSLPAPMVDRANGSLCIARHVFAADSLTSDPQHHEQSTTNHGRGQPAIETYAGFQTPMRSFNLAADWAGPIKSNVIQHG